MITLRKFAYQFIDDFSGGGKTTDSKLDERDVILKIRQLMNKVMMLKYYEKYQEGDQSAISLYISTYKLTMQNDPNLNRAYVTLPEFYNAMKYNRGIHRIWRLEYPDNDIVLSHHPGVSQRLRAGNVAGIFYAYAEGLNIVFRNVSVDPDDDPEEVVVQLIVAGPDSIGINDPLPITPDQQSDILKGLMEIYRPVPQDLAINANPNQ